MFYDLADSHLMVIVYQHLQSFATIRKYLYLNNWYCKCVTGRNLSLWLHLHSLLCNSEHHGAVLVYNNGFCAEGSTSQLIERKKVK